MPRISLTFAFVALLGVACGSEDSPGGTDSGATQIEIVASNFTFSPTSIDAEAGDEISLLLTNDDEVDHSFTIDDLIDVEAEGGGVSSGTFTAPDATVEFYCRYHPDTMRGEVTIAGSSGADTGGGGTMDDQDLDY